MKLYGYKMLNVHNIKAVYDHMQSEGTCCLAYHDFDHLYQEMLLVDQPELQALRNSQPDDAELNERWCELDTEIVETLIMLPVMANLDADTLYWCSNCHSISRERITCDCKWTNFGIDLTE